MTTPIAWVLCHVAVDGHDDLLPVTMPIPIATQSLAAWVAVMTAPDNGMIPVRGRVLHGDRWPGGTWTVVRHEVITASRARELFPGDPFSGASAIEV